MARTGISQAELARQCGIKQPSVNGWLSGKAKFLRGENLLKAAAALGVSEEWLATGDGPMDAAERGSLSLYQPVRPDPAILLATQGFLEKAYSGLGKKFSLMTDADLFADVYEWIAEDDRPVDQRNLVDFAQWRGKKEDHGGGNEQNGQADGQAAGADRRRAAG